MVVGALTISTALLLALVLAARPSPRLTLTIIVAIGVLAGTFPPPVDAAQPGRTARIGPITNGAGMVGPMLPVGTADAAMRKLFPQADPYALDFTAWCRDKLGVHLWSLQSSIGDSVRDHRLTAVPSCHGAGKSYEAALLLAWWLDTHPPQDVFVVFTAPSASQVKAVIGRYLPPILLQLGTGYRVLGNMEVKAPDGSLVGFGRKPADHQSQTFSGIHADYVLIVVDEATGVKVNIWNAVRSFMTTSSSRLIAIGNPDDPQSYFRETVHDPKLRYNVLRIDGLRLPTMTEEACAPYPKLVAYMEAEGIPYATEPLPEKVRRRLTQPEQWDEWLDEWGAQNPYFASKVRGAFPLISERALFTPAMLEQAFQLEIKPRPQVDGWYAFDIAEEGDDETVGYLNREGKIRRIYSAHRQSTMETVGAIREILDEHSRTVPAWIDANAVGSGVWGRLVEQDYPALSYKGSRQAMDPGTYFNRRSEVYYTLAKMIEDGLIDLDREDKLLAAQLLDIHWKYHSGGLLQLETRKERAARNAKSPDRADAVVMAAASPEAWTAPSDHEPPPGTPPARSITAGMRHRPM